MSDLQAIEAVLERTAKRRRLARALRGLWTGLLWGSALSLVLLAGYKLLPLPDLIVPCAAILPVAGAIAGALATGLRKAPLTEVARWVDQHEHLQERLSTAWEVGSSKKASTWNALVVRDAVVHITNLDPARLIPLRLTKTAKAAAVVLAACTVLGFVPEHRSAEYQRRKADVENIQETGRRITEFAKRSVEKRPPAMETARAAMEATVDLGEGLEKKILTRTDAIREIAKAAEQVRARANELTKDPAMRQMRQAARASGEDAQTRDALQKKIDDLKQQLGTPASPEQLDKLKSQTAKAQHAAQALTSQDANAQDAQKLGNDLADLSRQAQALGLHLPELDAAIEALAAQQTEMLLKNLEASLADLEKLSQMAKTLQALQQRADRVGKDLAEQLEKGQAENAHETLTKLAKQLQNSGLSPEALNKILEEVAKAISPAEDYGKVAQHLKNAASRMKEGAQGEASQSLQAAAKELENLMQQFGDAEMLMATLDALKDASMCVGAGQCWALGNKPGSSRGGKPGSGVGTWADESQEWDGATTEMADNSGVQRPDMESRSGDAEPTQSDALTPTKVRGQFSPGGQMPSISLRGVGIKGQSSVAYEQAAEAAQSQAESALSQDKVPRAYRETVKTYFDELKE